MTASGSSHEDARPSLPSPVDPGRPLGRQLLTLFVVFSIGPLFLSNLWGYLQTRSRLRDAAFRDVQNVASIEAAEGRRSVLQKHELLASLIAGNQHLFSLMRSSRTCQSDAECQSVRRALASHLRAKQSEGRLVELTALSIDVVVLATSWERDETTEPLPPAPVVPHHDHDHADSESHPHEHGEPPSPVTPSTRVPHATSPACIAAVQRGEEISLETDDAEPLLVIVSVVEDPSGENLGFLCGRFEFDVHRFLMATTHERTASATSYLVDRNGEVICSSLHHQGRELGSEPGRTLAHPAGRLAWAERAEDGELLAAYAPVPELPWGVLVELSVTDALAELETLKWQALVFGSILSIVLMVVAVVASRRIARPLKRLALLAGQAAGGALGVPLKPEGPKEVVELACAFNEMSVALKESHTRLESRIAERTGELERSREFLESLLDSIDQRVLVVGSSGTIIRANRPALEAYGGDVVGARYADVVGPTATVEDPVRATIESGRAQSLERAHGTGPAQRIVHAELFPVRLGAGEVDAVIEVARDITTDKRLQAQLIHQERMATLGLLTAGMAHDIGNPLASILAQLRMTREVGGEERMRASLDVVEREIQRISRQLRDFVALSRRRRDVAQRLDLNGVVQDVVTLLAYNPSARGCDIQTRLCSAIPPIRAEEDLIVQVLLNLCINALDAMAGEGVLTISTQSDEGWATVRVADSGPGIPVHLREQIFDALVSTKPVGRGTGLGLFMSRNLAETLGGQLELASTGDEGTAFELRLPLEQSPARREAT